MRCAIDEKQLKNSFDFVWIVRNYFVYLQSNSEKIGIIDYQKVR